MAAAPVFEATPYFMSEEYSLIDCAMAPFLWRLASIGIDITSLGKGITAYANRLFIKKSLSGQPHQPRKGYDADSRQMTPLKPYLIRSIYEWIVRQ